jgi:hypothetical protein
MEHRRQASVRIAQPLHQGADGLEPEASFRHAERGKAIELALNCWIGLTVRNRALPTSVSRFANAAT